MGSAGGQATEFLNQILSQRGPQAVPYKEDLKYTIRQHLSDLLKTFPSLTLRTSEYYCNDGRILHLIKSEGTVPIHFQGNKYNIPVTLWLLEHYPVQAPLVYVNPTANMIIKQSHTFVNPSGEVRTPSILNWLYPSSDLIQVAGEMCILFGTEPPLFSKPPGYVQPPQQPLNVQPPPQQYHNPMVQQQQQQQQQQRPPYPYPDPSSLQRPDPMARPPWDGGQYAAAGYGPAAGAGPGGQMGGRVGSPAGFPTGSPASPLQPLPTAGSTSSPVKPPPPPKPSGTARELEAGARDLTVVALRQRLAAGLEHFQQHAAGEMERLLGVQQKLAARDRELGATVAAIQSERAGCEGLVTELHLKAQQLDKWLQENEWKMPKDGQDIDINAVVMAADDLSRQALAAQAEDLAVEDTLTVLDKACQEGKLDAPEYLRQVRILCKRQFFARAKGLKVAAVQQSQPPPPHQMARGYSLTHGDSWAQSNILTNPLSSGK